VTDASLVLGHIDPAYFLGGAMALDGGLAARALEEHISAPLGLSLQEAASAVLQVVTENMALLIEEIALNRGVDPRRAVLVGGGGGAGLNAVAIGQRLGCRLVVIPEVGPVLSAVGGLLSDLTRDFDAVFPTRSDAFDHAGVGRVFARLEERCRAFIAGPGADAAESAIELSAYARYPSEIWELEVPLRNQVTSADDVRQLCEDFHAQHREVFSTSDPGSSVVLISWRARARCRLRNAAVAPAGAGRGLQRDGVRRAHFRGVGMVEATVRHIDGLEPGERLVGPAIVESAVTTVVVEPGAALVRSRHGSLLIEPGAAA